MQQDIVEVKAMKKMINQLKSSLSLSPFPFPFLPFFPLSPLLTLFFLLIVEERNKKEGRITRGGGEEEKEQVQRNFVVEKMDAMVLRQKRTTIQVIFLFGFGFGFGFVVVCFCFVLFLSSFLFFSKQ